LRYRGFERTSRYLTMRDGVRIAVDICLPRGLAAGERVSAMVRQTRYFQRFQLQAGPPESSPEAAQGQPPVTGRAAAAGMQLAHPQ